MKNLARHLLASLLFLATSARAELVDKVAAVVNKDVIALSEVQQRAAPELSRLGQEQDAKRRGELRGKVLATTLEVLIGERLMEADARELGLNVSDEDLEAAVADVQKNNNVGDPAQFEQMLGAEGYTIATYREFLRKQLTKMKLVQTRIAPKVKLGEEDVKAEYARYARLEGQDGEVHARHILVEVLPSAPAAEVEKARARAAELAVKAREPGVDFAELAKSSSEGSSAADGGDLGFFRRGLMLPAFDKAAFSMKDGEVSDPVRSNFGWHVIKVEERRSVGVKSFEEMKQELMEKLRRQRTEKSVEQYVQELRQKATVEVKRI